MRDPTRASFPKREKRVVAVFSKEQVRLSNAKMRSPTPERMQKRKRERSPSRDRVLAKGTPVNTELRVLIKSAKQRRQKARQRQKRFAQRMRATRGELSILETKSVKDPQKRDYLRRLEEFYDFISHHEIDIKDEVKLDEALCEYSDHMFLNGESNSSGQKLKAALEFCRPESVRKGELHLPRFKRALKGWRRMAPTQTRLPMIEFIKGAITGVMLYQNHHDMALYNELTFSTYARPGEMLKVLAVDVIQRNQQFHHDVIALAPFERGEESKTGVFDEVLILDDVRMPCLGELVVQLAKNRIRQEGEAAHLWTFSAKQYLDVWRSCVMTLGLEEIAESPRRCFKGSSTAVAKCGSHPEARSMVQRQFSQDLRQAGQTAATYQQSQWRAGALRRKHENAFQKLVPRWEGGSAKKSERENSTVFQVERFLSLFGGVGNPAKFWCQMGGTAAVIDLADSSQNDLGKHSCWNDVDKNLHAFDVVGIDMPCNTWSRARRAPWWSRMPKPLRKAGEYIFGLPWLSELERIKVNKANIMLKRAVKVIRKCLKLGKSGYLENPMSSMIWQTPQIQRLLRDSRVKLCPLEMCMYNTQWKKPTFILLWNAPATNFLRCTGRRVCTRTGKSHMQLTGISGKRFLTEQAQVYSKEFSKALMLTFLHDPKTHPPRAILKMGLGREVGDELSFKRFLP